MNIDGQAADSYILFELAGTTYGLNSSVVQQLEMVEHITPVPNTDSTVEGVVFCRGEVIPAISLRKRFGFETIPYDLRSRLVVVRVKDRNIGLIVDAAREFKNIPEELIVAPPAALAATTGHYLRAIATVDDNTILLIDLEELIQPEIAETAARQG